MNRPQGFASQVPSDSHAVQLYEWAERSPSAVLKCICRQVRRLKILSSLSHALGGQNLFLHYETPGLIAEVCGMVVGITPKEDQVTYDIDDGTDVVRAIETRKSLRQAESRTLQAGPSTTAPCGVPECYIMPPQPKASSGTSSTYYMLPPLNPRFRVADIVKCTGKVQLDRDGDRFIFAKSICKYAVALVDECYSRLTLQCFLFALPALCQDVNAESLHQIEVVELENQLYRKPFDWNRVGTVKMAPPQVPSFTRISLETSARSLVTGAPTDDKAEPAPLSGNDEEQQSLQNMHRLSRDEARSLLSSDGPTPSPSSESSLSLHQSKCPASSGTSLRSKAATRQLRAHDKIADCKLTESYFQLQLQQHISLRYQDHAFTLPDLISDAGLSSLARRLVRLRLQLRASSRTVDKARRISSSGSEHQAEKVRRLFEWAMRKMMQDGFVTLADSDQPKHLSLSETNTSDSTEQYRLVTPEYLLDPVRRVLGSRLLQSPQIDSPDHIDHLTARLRLLDDRFRFLNRSIVSDTLTLCRERYAPIVID